jgi:hypothetical protein
MPSEIDPPSISRCDSISPESLLRCEKPAGHDDGPEPTAHEARRSEHGTAAWGNEPPSDSGADDFYREVDADGAPPPDYNTILREYLDLYANQPPRQAELIVPAWALRRFNALTREERLQIMIEIDHVAAMHGLLTPTKLIVMPNG